LERSFPLLGVRGEIASLTRAGSGHWYFLLKDESAQVRAVMFRGRNILLDWSPREGDEVEVRAVVNFYQPRGEFQLTIESMRRAGLGRLYEEFVRLRNRLAAEGLFDAERRRPLPRIAWTVGVVTSLQAAALRDVLTALARRAPYARVVVYPCPVQGAEAASRIAQALATASARREVDVLLLVRGGGSIEDLWSFNEEVVARAIRASRVPVVVGVGHESDVTIADLAADLRAPTPTAAAELATPPAEALAGELSARLTRASQVLAHALATAAQRLDYAVRTLSAPRAPLAGLDARVGRLATRATALLERRLGGARLQLERARAGLERRRPKVPDPRLAPLAARLAGAQQRHTQARAQRLATLRARLEALAPEAVLARGYALALDAKGRAVTNSASLAQGDALRLVFARGAARARVESVEPPLPDGQG
jgi:exodeoxyribonuclease VII large subunit